MTGDQQRGVILVFCGLNRAAQRTEKWVWSSAATTTACAATSRASLSSAVANAAAAAAFPAWCCRILRQDMLLSAATAAAVQTQASHSRVSFSLYLNSLSYSVSLLSPTISKSHINTTMQQRKKKIKNTIITITHRATQVINTPAVCSCSARTQSWRARWPTNSNPSAGSPTSAPRPMRLNT